VSDPWGSEESDLNKLGTKIMVFPTIVGALLVWGILPIAIPTGVVFAIVGICGLVGGGLNVHERAPLWGGALAGLVATLGGLGTLYWWMGGRESVFFLEVTLAFVLGALPGYLLQYVLARLLVRKKQPAEDSTPGGV